MSMLLLGPVLRSPSTHPLLSPSSKGLGKRHLKPPVLAVSVSSHSSTPVSGVMPMITTALHTPEISLILPPAQYLLFQSTEIPTSSYTEFSNMTFTPSSLSLSQPLLASQPPPRAYPHGLSDSPALTSPVPIRPSWQSHSGALPFSPCDIPQTDAQPGSLCSTAGTSEHTRVVTPMCHNERPPGKLVSPFCRRSTSGICSLLSPPLSLP